MKTKQLILTTFLTLLMLTTISTSAFAEQVNIVVNGNAVKFTDVKPYINNDGRAMVPLRFISEQLGATVAWDNRVQTALIEYDKHKVSIRLNQKTAMLDNKGIELDTSAVMKENRTVVPLRFVSEALGAKVLFAQATNTIRISNSNLNDEAIKTQNNKYQSAPKLILQASKNYNAEVITNRGAFKIKLFSKQAPLTVNNFVFLAREGFYDGVLFHRIIKDFMVQTGDPLGNGTGSPGYKFADELPVVKPYGPGIVAMANSGPDTNGSQFFICNGADSKSLNQAPNYTVFGEVTQGMEVILKISDTPVESSWTGELSKPMEDIYIEKITIIENS